MTNEAEGVSLTVDYTISDGMAAKLLLSDRHSEYKAGLDDDGFFDDFLSFPETGEADQQSAELQLTGTFGAWDYVAGLYWFEEEGKNVQDPTIFLGGPGDFLLTQEVRQPGDLRERRLQLLRRLPGLGRPALHAGRQDGRYDLTSTAA